MVYFKNSNNGNNHKYINYIYKKYIYFPRFLVSNVMSKMILMNEMVYVYLVLGIRYQVLDDSNT